MARHKMSLSVDYVPDWGVQEALRELFQNAIDWGNWSWSINDDELCITSHMAELENKTLLLGHSKKADGAIGKFGEGYKLAMLVLCRLGYECWIENRNSLWQPKLINSRTYGTKQLVFDTSPIERPYPAGGLLFIIKGISKDIFDELKTRNLHVQAAPVLHPVDKGQILSSSQAGRMYVGGLYICTLEGFKHGYNFEPHVVSLDRDRRMLQEFNVAYNTSDMWIQANDNKYAASLVKEEAADVQYLIYHKTKSIAEELHSEFVEDHGEEAVAVSVQYEIDQAKEEGHEKIVVVPKSVLSIMRTAPSYHYPAPRIVKLTPKQKLNQFFDIHRNDMTESMEEDFLKLLEESINWS